MGNNTSKFWILDNFPFPVKPNVWSYNSERIPIQEFTFELLDYKENVSIDPFIEIYVPEPLPATDCTQDYKLVPFNAPSEIFSYYLKVLYGPENLQQGCANP